MATASYGPDLKSYGEESPTPKMLIVLSLFSEHFMLLHVQRPVFHVNMRNDFQKMLHMFGFMKQRETTALIIVFPDGGNEHRANLENAKFSWNKMRHLAQASEILVTEIPPGVEQDFLTGYWIIC